MLRIIHAMKKGGSLSGLDLVIRPEIQSLFDHVAALHGIRIAFYAPGGEELRVGQARPNCGYCRMLRGDLGYEGECRRLDAARRAEAADRGDGFLSYRCHGGMNEAIMPVRLSGRLLGFVMIGQFRTLAAPPGPVLRRAGPRSAARLRRLYSETPFFTTGQAAHLFGLFRILVAFIGDRRLVETRDVTGPLLARLRDRPEERLSLKQAAATIGLSPTALAHRLRRETGCGFRALKIRALLDGADRCFEASPGIRVKEVASRLGFEDPLYFSRFYRKHRGCPPRCRIVQ